MSRLRIFFLFAAIAALATTFAACGGSSDDGGGSSGENPQSVIEDATFEGVESGNIDLTVSVDVVGEEGGNVDVSLTGPFQSRGEGQFPLFDLSAKAEGSVDGEDVDFEGGLTLLSDKAFVDYEGTDYEVDPNTFGFVKAAIEKAQSKGGQSGGSEATACQEAATGLEIGDFLDNLSNEGTSDVGDTGTTQVSGDLNATGAIDALIELVETPACAAQLGAAGPLPSTSELDQAKGEVQSALKKAHVDVYVGDDDIVRRVAAELSIEPPADAGGEDTEKVEVSFDLSLEGVNEDQSISGPSGAKPLNELFLKLGINPLELLSAAEGGGLGDLLEGLGAPTGGLPGSGDSSGSSGGGSSPGGSQKAYLNCLQGAKTPVDLQECAALLQ